MSKWNILEYFKRFKKMLLHKVCFILFLNKIFNKFLKVVFEIFNISTNEFRTRIVEYDEVAGD
jgi:hypothetical protein